MFGRQKIKVNSPAISIIIPMFNCEEFIEDCLNKLQRQTLKNIEIICVDDGSEDKTLEIVKNYSLKDNRLVILSQQNLGSGAARNYGMKVAKGDFIAFLDADDYHPFDFTLEHLYNNAKDSGLPICGGSLYQFSNGDLITDSKKFDKKYTFEKDGVVAYRDYQFDYGYWRFIYKRQFLLDNKLTFPDYLRGQDPPFFVQAMICADSFYAMREATYVYRVAYKKVNWTVRRLIDAYKSDADLLKLSKQHSLDELHCLVARRLSWTSLIPFVEKEKEALSIQVKNTLSYIDYEILDKCQIVLNLPKLYRDILTETENYQEEAKLDTSTQEPFTKQRFSIFGIPVYQKYKTQRNRSLRLFGIPIYSSQNEPFEKRLNLFGLTVYSSKHIEGYKTVRRFLLFKTTRSDETKRFVMEMTSLLEYFQKDILKKQIRIESLCESLLREQGFLRDQVNTNKKKFDQLLSLIDFNSSKLIEHQSVFKTVLHQQMSQEKHLESILNNQDIIRGRSIVVDKILENIMERLSCSQHQLQLLDDKETTLKQMTESIGISLGNLLDESRDQGRSLKDIIHTLIQDQSGIQRVINQQQSQEKIVERILSTQKDNQVEVTKLGNVLNEIQNFVSENQAGIQEVMNQHLSQDKIVGSILSTQKDNQVEVTKLGNVLNEILKSVSENRVAIQEVVGQHLSQDKIADLILRNQELVQIETNQQNKVLEDLLASVRKTYQMSTSAKKAASEAVWALTYEGVSSECDWLNNKKFAPGRWALGFPAMYLLFRVLDEAKPKRILELGLGQSTRLIAQFVSQHEDVEHVVIEHDQKWIEFFKNDFELSEKSEIICCDRTFEPYDSVPAVRLFEDFEKKIGHKKFDLIFIDAPFGGDMKQFSRIDVLKLLPNCLLDSFIIILDDTNRKGELNTFKKMTEVLNESGIETVCGSYAGDKTTSVICSSDKAFFASM